MAEIINDLDFLLDKEKISDFLNQNALKIFSQEFNIQVLEIKRSHTYNPDSYNILYKISLSGQSKEIRASASRIVSNNKEIEFKILKYYFDNGFGSGEFLVTKPLAFFKDLNLMFYENIEGSVFMESLSEDLEKLSSKIKSSAILLKKIHQLPKPSFDLWQTDLLFVFQDYEKNALTKYYPKVAEKLDSIINSIKEKADKIKSSDFCHGDFQPANIIFSTGKTYILDFGLNCLLDREYDVAVFISQLRVMLKRYGDFNNFPILEKLFLETYGSFNEEKYNFYGALVNLRILVTFCISQGKENNLDYMPLVYNLLKEDLKNMDITIDD